MSRRLYRSRDDRMLAGVAGGLAELWDADPSLVRVVWLILIPLTGGFALLAYIVMAFVVPEAGDEVALYPSPATAAASGEPGSAPATDGPPAAPSGSTSYPAADWRSARREAREARRDARRANWGRGSGGLLIGALLVIAGVYFLVREYVPNIDLNWLWPAALIVLGIVVLASAFRRPSDGQTPPGSPQ